MTKDELEIKFKDERQWLNVRAKNILQDSGVYLFDDFYKMYIENAKSVDFKSLRNCGAKTEKELNEFVQSILSEAKELLPKTEPDKPIVINSRIDLVFEERFDRLQNRAKNVLKKAGANTFKGFYEQILQAESPDSYILRLRNCGVTTQKEILKFKAEVEELALSGKWNNIPNGIFADIQFSFFETNLFTERELLIVQDYYCIEQNRESETLDDISKVLELTRERVRQISVDILKKIKRNVKRIVEKSEQDICKYFIQDYFEVDSNLAEQINNSEGTNFCFGFISYVLETCCPVNYTFINTGANKLPDYRGIIVNNSIPLKFQACFKFLTQQRNTRRNKDIKIEVENLIERFRINNRSTLFQEANDFNLLDKMQVLGVLQLFASNLANEKNQIDVNSECIVFKRNTKKLKYEYLAEILREYKRPMHFSELENESKRRGLSIKSVQGALMHHPETFGLKGQGTYGLIEWGGYFGSIGDVTEQLLRERKEPIDRKELEDILCRELYISQDSIREVLLIMRLRTVL